MRWLGRQYKATVCVGRDEIAAAVGLKGGAEHTALRHWPMVSGSDGGDAIPKEQLSRVAEWILESTDRGYTDIHVLLSDPYVYHKVLSLDELPKKRAMQDKLIRWRLQEELSAEQASLSIAWQHLGARPAPGGGESIYAAATPCTVRDAVTGAFQTRHTQALSLRTVFQVLANHKLEYPLLTHGLVVYLAPDYWLTLRCGDNRITGIRCRWYEDDKDHDALRRDVARALNEEGVSRVNLIVPPGDEELRAGLVNQIESVLGGEGLSSQGFPVVPENNVSMSACIARCFWEVV